MSRLSGENLKKAYDFSYLYPFEYFMFSLYFCNSDSVRGQVF